MALDIGRVAYEAWVSNLYTTWKEWATWEELDKTEQDAWRVAACAVLEYIDKAKKESEEGLIG